VLTIMDAGLGIDPAAFFDAFYEPVLRFVARSTGAPRPDVEDLVQETLLEAWKSRDRFRGEAAPRTWVLAIARNRVRLSARARAGDRRRLEGALRALETERIPRDLVESDEARRRVRRALGEIGTDYAALLARRYFDGLSVRALAAERGENEKAVESRLHRAREAFRDALGREMDDDE
jgi:RNA polymerase sigma-70 factor (ECF subfamily)